jgi:hypothetical protein
MKLQNIVDCSNNDAIMASIKCELKSCPNKAGWCYIVDNIHLKVFPANIRAWSIAINDPEVAATLDMPRHPCQVLDACETVIIQSLT